MVIRDSLDETSESRHGVSLIRVNGEEETMKFKIDG